MFVKLRTTRALTLVGIMLPTKWSVSLLLLKGGVFLGFGLSAVDGSEGSSRLLS